MRIVLKFGGTSLAGPAEVRRAAAVIAARAAAGDQVAAVVSAQGGTTDDLLSTASLYNPRPSPRELDMLLTTGEQASAALLAMALEDRGLRVLSLTGAQAGIETDDVFGSARIRRLRMKRVERALSEGYIALIAGFQGVAPNGDLTTLGRGGSDTTAAAAAAALHADACVICTDVEGVYTADPRLVPEARKLPEIDTGEMLALAARGAKVLHERAAALAARFGVPLEVRSSFTDAPGTLVHPLPLPPGEGRVTALALSGATISLVGTSLRSAVPNPGVLAEHALAAKGIPLLSYLETEDLLSVQVPCESAHDALRALHAVFLEP